MSFMLPGISLINIPLPNNKIKMPKLPQLVYGQALQGSKGWNYELMIYKFSDQGCDFAYAPALRVTGYGYTMREADQSFEIALKEFFKYTLNKGTYEKVLKKYGWKRSGRGKSKKWTAPTMAELLLKDKYFTGILEKKDHQKTSKNVFFPAIAANT